MLEPVEAQNATAEGVISEKWEGKFFAFSPLPDP
jgi:hypothetical protein